MQYKYLTNEQLIKKYNSSFELILLSIAKVRKMMNDHEEFGDNCVKDVLRKILEEDFSTPDKS